MLYLSHDIGKCDGDLSVAQGYRRVEDKLMNLIEVHEFLDRLPCKQLTSTKAPTLTCRAPSPSDFLLNVNSVKSMTWIVRVLQAWAILVNDRFV